MSMADFVDDLMNGSRNSKGTKYPEVGDQTDTNEAQASRIIVANETIRVPGELAALIKGLIRIQKSSHKFAADAIKSNIIAFVELIRRAEGEDIGEAITDIDTAVAGLTKVENKVRRGKKNPKKVRGPSSPGTEKTGT